MGHRWDPDRYLTYADERGRPFIELLARVRAEAPARIVDLGCGPGNLTELLADRYPTAAVVGIDSSEEMIERARRDGSGRVRYEVGDLRAWVPDDPVDVLVSNATLQWVPDHLDLLPQLASHLAPGGWLAFQVPGNLGEPSHTIRRDLAAQPPYAAHLSDVAAPESHDAETYLETLVALGCSVDAWETTYLHVLSGEDPVFTWVSGTGARPTLEALPDHLRPEFEREFKRRLRAAYTPGPAGTVLPFRRIFAVAQTPAPA